MSEIKSNPLDFLGLVPPPDVLDMTLAEVIAGLDARDARISDLEARLAVCVGALTEVNLCMETEFWVCNRCGEQEAVKDCNAHYVARGALSSPDLAPWREMIEAVRECGRVFCNEDAGPRECERAVDRLLDSARRCGLGAER